jgi:tRNA A37 N6-isopentenylltransferase MiaA
MTKYFQKAQAIEKEIVKYCHYGAENRILRVEELLSQLGEVMSRANQSTKSRADVGLIHEIYREMQELVAVTKNNCHG